MDDGREWLEADGLGGFAMGTAAMVRTRRYHGLLIAATRPPAARMALVGDLEVFAETEGGRFALSAHRYRGDVVYPDGAGRIASFGWDPWPRWELALPDGTRIAYEIVVEPGRPRVLLAWQRLAGRGRLRLSVRPLLSGRNFHALHHENPAFRFEAAARGRRVTWQPYDGVPAVTALSTGDYRHDPDWFRHFFYRAEAARGLDAEEDLASPGVFELDLSDGPAVLALAAGQGAFAGDDPRALWAETSARERQRRGAFATSLHRAGDAYLVARGEGRTVIAGYPWFGDWGRDTFIAARGLCLATGRLDDARQLLLAWCSAISEGMLPNRFPDSGDAPEYNSVDASLWYVVAGGELMATGACSDAELRRLDDAIAAIVAGYHDGTRYGIACAEDGLLACGVPGVQLTWMDARVGDWVVTPRIGKPVEVQALWANALAVAGRRDPRWLAVLDRARASFVRRFWNDDRGMLYDVVDCDHHDGARDGSFRPNQILACGGLPLALLEGERARAVVDAVERELWTPAGLRSLARGEPAYTPRYEGGVVERDGCYHQGTAWLWLAGPFVEAWVRVRGGGADVRAEARQRFLAPLLARAGDFGLGHLGEIADAEPPHRGRGCPFQAWSVGEALRLDAML